MPAPVVLARWAAKYGPALLPVAQRLYTQGRFRQLAILHARTIVDGQYSWEMVRGERVWVVWSGDEVVATYPELHGDTEDLFTQARPDRRRDPDDVVVRRVRRRVRQLPIPSLPARGRTDDTQRQTDAETDED
jgi:hypothetical protein